MPNLSTSVSLSTGEALDDKFCRTRDQARQTRDQINELRLEVNQYTGNLKHDLSDLMQIRENLEADLKSSRAAVNDLNETAVQSEARMAALRKRIADLEERVLTAEGAPGELSMVRNSLATAKTDLEKEQGKVEFLQTGGEKLDIDISCSERRVARLVNEAEQRTKYVQDLLDCLGRAAPHPDAYIPQWIVNDIGELGVRVGARCFFLYKGDNIEYSDDDSTTIYYRQVGKREFGETCHPKEFTKPIQSPDPDSDWTMLPKAEEEKEPELTEGWACDPKGAWHYIRNGHLLCGDVFRWVADGLSLVPRDKPPVTGFSCTPCVLKLLDEKSGVAPCEDRCGDADDL